MRREKEKGAIMLEATYCISIVMILMVFILSLSFYMYQHAMVNVVAHEIAEEVSHVYKMHNAADSSSISRDDVTGTKRYRYLFWNENLRSTCETKMTTLAGNRLSAASLAIKKNGVNCDITSVTDDIGRRHYTVKVEQKYKFMLGGLLEAFGLEGEKMITAEAQTVGIDMLSYINTVKTTKYAMNKLQEEVTLLELVNNVIELISSVMD